MSSYEIAFEVLVFVIPLALIPIFFFVLEHILSHGSVAGEGLDLTTTLSSKGQAVSVVTLRGTLTDHNFSAILTQLKQRLSDGQRVIVDFRQLKYVDGISFGWLIQMDQRLQMVCVVNDRFDAILEMIGLAQALTIHPNLEQALLVFDEAIQGPDSPADSE